MTLKAFAEFIGRSPKNLYEVFDRPSMDTMLLQRCSEALHFNFFQLYTEELQGNVVADPPAQYGRRNKPTASAPVVLGGLLFTSRMSERVTSRGSGRCET